MLVHILTFGTLIFSPLAAHAVEQNLAMPSWSYDGPSDNMDEWGVLSPAYAKCAVGTEQSPVLLRNAKVSPLPVLATFYQESPAAIRLFRNAIHVSIKGDNTLTIEGTQYKLRYLSFHSPSEHVIGKDFFMGEIQYVHEDDKGNLLILSSLLQVGKEPNAALETILAKLPTDDKTRNEIRLDPSALLPQKRGYYAYMGSLSSPPCLEGVARRVLKEPVTITQQQLVKLVKPYGRNARMTQPLYTRTILQTQD